MTDPRDVPSLTLSTGPDGPGLPIPQVGFGVWQVPDDAAQPAVEAALATGYRHVDTARIYENEAGVGRALAATDVPREEIFVTTKVWNDDHRRVKQAFEESMERLGLETLDLFLVHWPVPDAGTYVEAWRGLLDLREAGRVRAVGVCNFHVPHLERLLAETGELPAINQIELHPYLQQTQLRAFHAEHGIVTESWSPLASGQKVLDDPVIGAIAAAHGVTPAQAIIRWHLQLGLVVLPKSVTPHRIVENLDVFGFTLSDVEMASIATLDRGFRTGPNPDEFHMDAA
jgi:2,5-diketo-D-gluconate reductase A